jgi:hypothetical protein
MDIAEDLTLDQPLNRPLTTVRLRTKHTVEQFKRGRATPAGRPLPDDARRGVLVALPPTSMIWTNAR